MFFRLESSPDRLTRRPEDRPRRLLVGVIHAPALPAAPHYCGNLEEVLQRVLTDAEAFVDGGADALLLENFGDVPFYADSVPLVTVAAMTRLASEISRRWPTPLGINMLRNDSLAALAVAHAAGGVFIRVNVLSGVRVTDQGLVTGKAAELLRQRRTLQADSISVLADVDVKHSAPLAPRPLEQEIHEAFDRGNADAIIVTGPATGSAADIEQLRIARFAAGNRPVLVGSGITGDNVDEFLPLADGFVVGTSCKRDGRIDQPVDRNRVYELAARIHG